MKKLLLVALMGLVGLAATTDALARYRRHGYYAAKECGSCNTCNTCVEECPPPPCCEREQTITVREAPRKVCGWVCPDGTSEIPASEARHANY